MVYQKYTYQGYSCSGFNYRPAYYKTREGLAVLYPVFLCKKIWMLEQQHNYEHRHGNKGMAKQVSWLAQSDSVHYYYHSFTQFEEYEHTRVILQSSHDEHSNNN